MHHIKDIQNMKNTHWENVKKNTLKATPRNHMTIWGADANGQLGREQNQPEKYNKIIGPYANKASPEKRKWCKNGKHLQRISHGPNEYMEKSKTATQGKKQ